MSALSSAKTISSRFPAGAGSGNEARDGCLGSVATSTAAPDWVFGFALLGLRYGGLKFPYVQEKIPIASP